MDLIGGKVGKNLPVKYIYYGIGLSFFYDIINDDSKNV